MNVEMRPPFGFDELSVVSTAGEAVFGNDYADNTDNYRNGGNSPSVEQ